MLTLDRQFIENGTQVYGDSENADEFYIIPGQPRFRVGDDGNPVFTFISYRSDPPRTDGTDLLGALTFFDVEFFPTAAEEQNARAGAKRAFGLNTIKLKNPTWLSGASRLLMSRDSRDGKEYTVRNAGKPSLMGKNVSSFNIQFDSEWAQIFLKGMSEGGGIVQVVYDLSVIARFSDTKVVLSYDVEQMRKFFAKVETSGDTITREVVESFSTTRLGKIDITFGAGIRDAAARANAEKSIRDWAMKRLEEQMQKQLDQVAGVSAETRKKFEDRADEAAKRDGYVVRSGLWFVYYYAEQAKSKPALRDDVLSSFSFRTELNERYTIEHEIHPQGTLPAVTTLKNAKTGAPVVWKDTKLSLNSEFFRRLNFTFGVDHTFADNSPIASVTVTLLYGDTRESHLFNRARREPWTKVLNYDKTSAFEYEYEVRYTDQHAPFRSGKLLSQSNHVILMDGDLGIAHVEIDAQGVLMPDCDCEALDVELSYPPTRFVKTLRFRSDDSGSDPVKTFIVPLYTANPQPFTSRNTYQFKDGGAWTETKEERSANIELLHPLNQLVQRTVDASALTAFTSAELVFEYSDPAIDYRRSMTVELTDSKTTVRVSIPARDRNRGQLSYSGSIRYENGTTRRVLKTAVPFSEDTIRLGDSSEEHTITVAIADSVWDVVRMVKDLKLRYRDQKYAARLPIREDSAETSIVWPIRVTDPDAPEEFEWDADLVYKDGKRPARRIRKQKVDGFDLFIDEA